MCVILAVTGGENGGHGGAGARGGRREGREGGKLASRKGGSSALQR